jgi:hypothetical protein
MPASAPPSGVAVPAQQTWPVEQFVPSLQAMTVPLHEPVGTQEFIGSMGSPPPPPRPPPPPASAPRLSIGMQQSMPLAHSGPPVMLHGMLTLTSSPPPASSVLPPSPPLFELDDPLHATTSAMPTDKPNAILVCRMSNVLHSGVSCPSRKYHGAVGRLMGVRRVTGCRSARNFS